MSLAICTKNIFIIRFTRGYLNIVIVKSPNSRTVNSLLCYLPVLISKALDTNNLRRAQGYTDDDNNLIQANLTWTKLFAA